MPLQAPLLLVAGVLLTVLPSLRAQTQGNPRVEASPPSFTLLYWEGPLGQAGREKFLYSRDDGARAEIFSPGSPGYTGWEPKTLVLPELRKRFLIAERARLVSTFFLSAADADFRKRPLISENCAHEAGSKATLAGQESILGVHTYHFESPAEAGMPGIDTWLAPKLGCFGIQTIHSGAGQDGVFTRVFERVPLSLAFAPPPGSVFEPPAPDFREVPPSEQQKAVLGQVRGTPFGWVASDAHLEKGFARFDRNYEQARQYGPGK